MTTGIFCWTPTHIILEGRQSPGDISSNGGTLAQIFFKPEKNLEFFRLKICAIDAAPGKLE